MSDDAPYLYAIALGSNRRHGRHGAPATVLMAALDALELHCIALFARSPIIASAPVGPSMRRYANMTALVATSLEPDELLARLKAVERDFGRRRGQRWGARVLDIDIILWSGGVWSSGGVSIPHLHWTSRRFVTDPLTVIAPGWRDPLSGRSVRQIAHRLARPKPIVDPPAAIS